MFVLRISRTAHHHAYNILSFSKKTSSDVYIRQILTPAIGPRAKRVKQVKMTAAQQTRDIDRMLGQRRRRWTNIGPTLGRCFLFAGRAA